MTGIFFSMREALLANVRAEIRGSAPESGGAYRPLYKMSGVIRDVANLSRYTSYRWVVALNRGIRFPDRHGRTRLWNVDYDLYRLIGETYQ